MSIVAQILAIQSDKIIKWAHFKKPNLIALYMKPGYTNGLISIARLPEHAKSIVFTISNIKCGRLLIDGKEYLCRQSVENTYFIGGDNSEKFYTKLKHRFNQIPNYAYRVRGPNYITFYDYDGKIIIDTLVMDCYLKFPISFHDSCDKFTVVDSELVLDKSYTINDNNIYKDGKLYHYVYELQNAIAYLIENNGPEIIEAKRLRDYLYYSSMGRPEGPYTHYSKCDDLLFTNVNGRIFKWDDSTYFEVWCSRLNMLYPTHRLSGKLTKPAIRKGQNFEDGENCPDGQDGENCEDGETV